MLRSKPVWPNLAAAAIFFILAVSQIFFTSILVYESAVLSHRGRQVTAEIKPRIEWIRLFNLKYIALGGFSIFSRAQFRNCKVLYDGQSNEGYFYNRGSVTDPAVCEKGSPCAIVVDPQNPKRFLFGNTDDTYLGLILKNSAFEPRWAWFLEPASKILFFLWIAWFQLMQALKHKK